MDETRVALARLAARFSFRDFPDFLVMLCRGDLSAIVGPLIMGPGWSQLLDLTRGSSAAVRHPRRRHRYRHRTRTSCFSRRLRPRASCGTTLCANNVDMVSSRVFTGGLGRKPASAVAIHLAVRDRRASDLSPEIGFRQLHERDTRRHKSEHVRVHSRSQKENDHDEKV